MLRWYLIHTKPSGETLAQENLDRQGYEVYLPRVIRIIRRRDHRRERIVALFPRYLFLRLSEGQQPLAPVHFTVGVTSVVRFGSRYTVVPDQVILDLQGRADPDSGLHRLNCGLRMARGTPVRIASGPFDGLEGVFEREAGAERVMVLLRLLGQDASVCVPMESILLSGAL
jgi:transcriptional antiterminator RfaH